MALLTLLAKLGAFVFVAYKISGRGPLTLRGAVTFALTAGGMLASFDGFTLAVREDTRARYGRVVVGVVVEKFSSTGSHGSRRIGTRGGRNQAQTRPVVTINGFRFYDTLGRFLITGSPLAWAVDYRFPCGTSSGCRGRDFVDETRWATLSEGQTVNVRQGAGETTTSRLDDNPRWTTAAVNMGIGGVLLLLAGLVSGRLAPFRSPRWVTAPAVVLAVEPVRDPPDPRWRIRFAYFDPQGVAQESADEVGSSAWKPGDQCLAVFQPTQPALATLRPLSLDPKHAS